MSLLAGSTLGAYQIIEPIGAGGMGEVYRARDTRLNRDVAVKILPDGFAADADRVARFTREAQTLASLNHPHIAQIHSFEQVNGVSALVMEYVSGADLSERIGQGALPLDEALAIAAQIIDALEAAHAQGIIHRDLKPANIKLRDDGTVKVLDFGLAKALEHSQVTGANAAAGGSLSPTITSPAMTGRGVILGTAAYMSPEQARGKLVDKRTDIWAFGCVVYEMLTGRRAFAADDITDVVAAIVTRDPDWSALPRTTPPSIVRLLRRCLNKDRARRLADISDARLEIEARDEPSATPAVTGAKRERWIWIAAVAGLLLAAGAGWLRPASGPSSAGRLQVDIATPPMPEPASFIVSPDGRRIAYAASVDGKVQLWMRSLDGSEERGLPGTDEARFPFWSPDGKSIGFFAGTRLKRIDVDNGDVRSLANVITPAGGAWSAKGKIVYSPNSAGGLFQIDENGGTPQPIEGGRDSLRRAERFPQFLPDGHRFIFFATAEGAGVYLDDLDRPGPRRLMASDAAATYIPGYLLLVRQRALLAQPVDPNSLEPTGSATRLANNIALGAGHAAVSAGGNTVIAFRAGPGILEDPLRWFDRKGTPLGDVALGNLVPRSHNLSPDNRYAAFQGSVEGNSDIWIVELARNVTTRITSEPGIDALPVWSPDGRSLVFNSQRSGGAGLYIQKLDGSPATRVLPGRTVDIRIACDWSPDGRYVLYKDLDNDAGGYDLKILSVSPPHDLKVISASRYDERDGQFSPDGKWVAFQSDETGRPEIYVQRFPVAGIKTRVSRDGGRQVRWHSSGNELFYLDGANRMTTASFNSGADSQPAIGPPLPLFRIDVPRELGVQRQHYAVSRDGTKFLASIGASDRSAQPITLLLNWNEQPLSNQQ